MLEHVGHEFYEDFFASCEYHLAEHGLLVLQVDHYQYIFILYIILLLAIMLDLN